jgi:hypothetical protein
MINLPSGLSAGISGIRARYHALRLNRMVSADTSHRELYGFVDIVVRPDHSNTLPYNPPYLFSGHTLADLHRIPWPASDRKAFDEWIRQEQQIREVDQVRKRLTDQELSLTDREYPYPGRLHSALRKRLERISMYRASPRQWNRTLLNMTRCGIRGDELTWSGLIPFLDRMQLEGVKTVTRDQLLSRIDFSMIRLSLSHEFAADRASRLEFTEIPTSKSINQSIIPRTITEPGDLGILRYVDPVHYYKVGYLKNSNTVCCSRQWFALDMMGNPIVEDGTGQYLYATRELAFSAASRHALQHLGIPVEYTHHCRYEHKTLHGGSDYREWLLTLPDYPFSHFTSHYYARNLLLHFRTKQRIDTHRRRLLFIEEIQSDWHQCGAMYGYQDRWPGRITPAPFRREWLGLGLKLILMHAAEHDFDAIAWTPGEVQEAHYFKRLSTVRRLYDIEIPKMLRRLGKDWNLMVDGTEIPTKEPRLHIARHWDKWFLTDKTGQFYTRPRFTQQEAMKVMSRHCKRIHLDVPMVMLSPPVRQRIREKAFPLFGENDRR